MTRFGLVLDPLADPGSATAGTVAGAVAGTVGGAAAQAVTAEQLGFDFVAASEHVFFYGPASNAFVELAAAAAVTSRVGLVSALTLLPLYPAALAAKMAASLDRLSGGRFTLGVGVGGEYPAEFAACGVPVRRRGAKADESLAILRGLLGGGAVTLDGEFARLDGLALQPPPAQRQLPVWVGGRKAAAQRRAARFGDAWLPYLISPEQLAAGLQAVRGFTEAAGRPPGTVTGAVYLWGSVSERAETARQQAVDGVSEIYQQDFAPLADRYLLAGDPGGVAARLRDYAAAGSDAVIFAPACPPSQRPEVVRLFAEQVLPQLR